MTAASARAATLGLAVFLGTTLAACGAQERNDDARTALRDTAANMQKIDTGDIDLRLVVTTHRAGSAKRDRQTAGFEVSGPLEFRGYETIPRADVRYVQIAGRSRAQARLVSDGSRIVAITDRRTVPIDADDLGGSSGDGTLADEVDIGRWINGESIDEGPDVDGERTDRISGTLDVVAVIEDVAQLIEQFGGSAQLPGFKDRDREQIKRAVRDASITLLTEHDDRLLRRLDAKVQLAPPDDLQLPPGARDKLATEIELHVGLNRLNQTIDIDEQVFADSP